MRIRKLELQGFKSFVDRQTFHFGSGIAGVVGPNGCGKSNVVDAVKWVIGETSAKSLRGASMSDVIFNGSAVRKKVGMAEVVVTFEAGGQPFPGDYARYEEVQIGRRLFRDGTSEYLLNGVRVRRRDVVDLLMDTGVSNKLYSFIEQGQIGQIVSAKPEQRRGLFEEAAGISRFKARKTEAESKLAETELNLDRATDVAEEMGRRLRTLERQVEKAARYRRLHARVRQGELYLGLVQYNELLQDRRAIGQRLNQARADTEALTRDLDQRDHELQGRRDEIAIMAKVVSDLRDQLSELEASRRETESARHYQDKEARTLSNRLDVLAHDLSDARRVRLESSTEADRLHVEATDARAALRDRTQILSELNASAQVEGRELQRVRVEVEGLKKRTLSLVTGLVRRRAMLDSQGDRTRETQQRIASLQADQQGVQGDLQVLEADLAGARDVVESAQQLRVDAQEALKQGELAGAEVRAQVDRLQRELSRAERDVTNGERDLARLETRVTSLRDLASGHAGVDGGARDVLKRVQTHGLLAEHLQVPEALEGVLNSALDGGLEYVLVSDDATLLQAAAIASRSGRTGLVRVGGDGSETTGLAAQVEGSAQGTSALSSLLGPCQVASTLAEALELHRAHGGRVVARTGELVLPNGVVLAGKRGKGAGAAILKRKRQLRELEAELTAQQQTQADIQATRDRVRDAFKAARGAAQGAQAKIDALRVALRQAQDEVAESRHGLRDRERELKSRHDRMAYLSREQGKLQARIDQISADAAREQAAIERDEARQVEAEELLKRAQAELVEREGSNARVRERLARARSEEGGLRERAKLLDQSLVSATRQRDESAKREARLSAEQSKASDRLRFLQSDDARLSALLQELGESQAERRDKIQVERQRLGRGRENMSAAEEALRGLRERRDTRQADASRQELKLQEVRLAIQALRERVEGRYNLRLAALLDRLEREAALVIEAGADATASLPVQGLDLEHVPDLRISQEMLVDADAVKAWVSTLDRCRKQLTRLGEVNLAALEEYTEVSERYQWLDEQRADLQSSVDTIRKTIARINRTCRQRFREAFDRVDGIFRVLYPRLVGGGSARLSLTNPDDLLETGVEIFVQPPGKRLQNLNLLSGGEKAMCAIGLLFSLFKVKPSPFCLLDEVDAPLDEGNGARFNAVLAEMSQLTQFIVITHNKKTMEVVDTLYGVTMPEAGISRLVTVKVG